MFCPECRTEYREGFTTCSDCGAELVAQLPPGESDDGLLVPIAMSESPEFVADLVDALEKAGVPYVIQAGTALAVLDGAESFDDLSWQARVIVSRELVERAQRILRQVEERHKRGGLFTPEPA